MPVQNGDRRKGELIGQGRTAEVYTWGEGRVLKLFYPDWPLGAIDRESRISQVIQENGLAAPLVEGVVRLEGRLGIVYEWIEGPSMLRELSQKPWTFTRVARQFAELHLSMHRCLCAEFPSQREQMVGRIQDSSLLSAALKSRVLERLERLPDGNAVCHGDFHPDNILVSPRGPVVIDWMGATRGHPLADVATTALLLRISDLPPGIDVLQQRLLQALREAFYRAYARWYFRSSPYRQEQVDDWVAPAAAAILDRGRTPGEQERLAALVEQSFEGKD